MDDSTHRTESDTTAKEELDRLRIRSQRDVQRMWELLMRPLGFRSTSLWVSFIGVDDRPTRFLLEVAEAVEIPDAEMVGHLFGVLEQIADEDGTTGGAAFLITRPGRDGVTAFDRRFAARLVAGAADSTLKGYPVHVANDLTVVALTPDDLAA